MNPLYKFGLGIALFLFLAIALLWYIQDQQDKSYQAGKDSCVATQATEQVKHSKDVKATYDKIEMETPSAGDDDAIAVFLRRYVRQN